jgi:hypothetical protein
MLTCRVPTGDRRRKWDGFCKGHGGARKKQLKHESKHRNLGYVSVNPVTLVIVAEQMI